MRRSVTFSLLFSNPQRAFFISPSLAGDRPRSFFFSRFSGSILLPRRKIPRIPQEQEFFFGLLRRSEGHPPLDSKDWGRIFHRVLHQSVLSPHGLSPPSTREVEYPVPSSFSPPLFSRTFSSAVHFFCFRGLRWGERRIFFLFGVLAGVLFSEVFF